MVNPIAAAIPKESNSETSVHKSVDKSTTEARMDVEYQNVTAKDTRTIAPLTNRRMNRIRPRRINRNITVALATRAKTKTSTLREAMVTLSPRKDVTRACGAITIE